MLLRDLLPADWGFLASFCLLAVMFAHQAWCNLIRKRVSSYSIDALGVFLAKLFASTSVRERVKRASRDPQRLLISGIFALLAAGKAIEEVFKWLARNLW